VHRQPTVKNALLRPQNLLVVTWHLDILKLTVPTEYTKTASMHMHIVSAGPPHTLPDPPHLDLSCIWARVCSALSTGISCASTQLTPGALQVPLKCKCKHLSWLVLCLGAMQAPTLCLVPNGEQSVELQKSTPTWKKHIPYHLHICDNSVLAVNLVMHYCMRISTVSSMHPNIEHGSHFRSLRISHSTLRLNKNSCALRTITT
jgi:hypothetical protein